MPPRDQQQRRNKMSKKRMKATFYVNIPDNTDFNVVKRIIGPKGRFLKRITYACKGSRIRLRGKGTNVWVHKSGI